MKQATSQRAGLGGTGAAAWLITMTLVVVQSLVASPVRGEDAERPPVQLLLDPCVDLSSLGVRRIVTVELGALLVDTNETQSTHQMTSTTLANVTRVDVQCSHGAVVVEVDDPITGTCLRRRVNLSSVDESARVRTLAVAIVEAVAASWVELELGVDQSPACLPRARPGPDADQLAARRYDQMSTRTWVAAVGFAASAALQPGLSGAESVVGAAGQCVPAEVRQRVLACPSTERSLEKRGSTTRRTASKVTTRRRAHKAQDSQRQDSEPQLGSGELPRPSSALQQKQRARYEILKREARLTERLRGQTAKNHATYPDVAMRLSQIYEDLAAAVRSKVRDLDESIFRERQARGEGSRGFVQLQKRQRTFEREEIEWRVKAIQGYREVAESFPDHPHRAEILFRQGAMLEELAQGARLRREAEGAANPSSRERGLREKARHAYQDLIRSHPSSRFVPHAYLSFAEHYFQEGDMEAALRLYERAAEDEASDVFGFAVYKRAWCQINLQRDREAVSDFVRVIEHATQSPDSSMARPLARSARMELVQPYSRAFGPGQAWAFFQRVGGSAAVQMMEALAQHYFDQGQWSEAIAAYHSLLANNRESDHQCLYQARVAESTRRDQSRSEQVLELRRTVDLMNTFLAGAHPDEDERQCQQEVAQLVIDVATSWHQETVGTDSAPGTGDTGVMQMASEVYALALSSFANLDELELDGWSSEDRPTLYRLHYWAAELLWSRRDWQACGPAFDEVVELDPRGEHLRDAAYSSVLCYDNLLQAERGDAAPPRARAASGDGEPSLESLRRRDLTEREEAMLGAFTRYVCRVSESPDLVRVKYRRAMIYYDANHFAEAAELFRDVAFAFPADELAPIAAQYHVDALNALSRLNQGRVDACQEAIDVAAQQVLSNRQLSSDTAVRAHFTTLRCEIQWARADRYARAGDHDRCAALFLGIYRDYSDECREIGEHGLDEVLYNAAICLESDYRIGQAIQVRRRLIEEYGDGSPYERENGRPSRWAQRALHQIGGNYHAIAAYTKAAQYYENYAQRYPGENEAAGALRNATVIRLGLGQHDQALQNSRLFEKNYGRRQAEDTATVVGAVGSLFLHQEQWREAEGHYRAFLKRYGSRASVDELISARVNLGFALWKQRQRNQQGPRKARATASALREFRAAVALVDRGRPTKEDTHARLGRYRKLLSRDQSNEDLGADETRRLVRMVTAVSKARFYIAEEAFERFAAIDFPGFRPNNRLLPAVRSFWTSKVGRDDARRWEQGLRFMSSEERQRQLAQVQFEHWTEAELTPWVERRQAAQKRAEVAFLEVVREDVPEWEIAAAARIGEMHRDMMQTFYDTPIPPLVREDEELRAIYEQAIDERAQPFRELATTAYEHCLHEATKNRWFNEWSRGCERRLHHLSPRDYPMADEFRTSAVHTGRLLAVPHLVSGLENGASLEEVAGP